MTTRGRKARSMTPGAIAKREKYAADKAAKLAAQESASLYASPDNPSAPIAPDDLQVEITPNEAPKLSLKDRLFGGAQQPGAPTKAKTVKKGQRGKQIDASLLAKTFPTMVATMTASYAQRLIKDPYKPCAPTQQEIYGTIGPLFSILSRRIEIVGTASEDIIDLISSVLAGLVAGIRIHITYLSIQESIQKVRQNGHVANGTVSPGSISNGRTDTGTKLDSSQETLIPTGLSRAATYAGDDDSYPENGNNGTPKGEAELFADLAQRDRAGRVRLGLIAR